MNHTYDYTKALKNATYEGFGLPSVRVILHLGEYEPDGEDCKFTSIKIKEEWTRTQVNKNQDGKCDTSRVQKKLEKVKSAAIDCNDPNKQYAIDTFEGQFCLAYNNASVKVIGKGTNDDASNKKSKISFDTNDISANGRFKADKVYNAKCEYGISNETLVPRNPDELTGDGDDALKNNGLKDYFVNKKYYFAQLKITETYGKYSYYYVPGTETKGKDITCTRVCSEAVVVEYGPPVAKKAGMCFEYKMRITSRVDCHVDKTPTPPDSKCKYCTPAPYCHGGKYKQGGPNDEYDSCVQECDNGKYTKKCSDKCYKEVYGTTAKKSNTNSLSEKISDAVSDNLTASKTATYGSLSHCKKQPENENGCYFISNGISWSPGYNNNAPGRWYRHNKWAATVENPGPYDVREKGFYRHYYSETGDYCNGDCKWLDCRDDKTTYLNPSYTKSDYDRNYKKWEAAIDACNTQATCVTETSTYTISANYNETWEVFPRKSKDKDQLSKTKTTEGNKFTSLLPNYSYRKDGHNGIRGCYYYDHESGKAKERMYRSTWHFPGTWMNAKTGEISYDENTGSGWGEYKDKFCIPFNTEPVNSDWWIQFYNNRLKDASLNMSYKKDNIGTKCLTGNKSGINFNSSSKPGNSAIKWNIKGEARNFGYFGWNFDIECFYATPPYPITNSGKKSTTPNDKNAEACTDDLKVRSFEKTNMFPEANGGSTKSVTLSAKTGSTAQVGRQPGFNWSEYAVQDKNTNYKSDPVALIKKIQEPTYSKNLYTDSNLDYQFKLGRDELARLRADVKGNQENISNYKDSAFYMDENGVLRYESALITQYASVRPNHSALKCNNLRNSSSCEN